MENLTLNVEGLKTWFYTDDGILKAVDGVDFSVGLHKTLGIIGESGSGKSVTAQSILRIVPDPGRIMGGKSLLKKKDGNIVDTLTFSSKGIEIKDVRRNDISMIFQEPMTSLSPIHTIENQICEAILLSRTKEKKEAEEIALDMLNLVGISNPKQRLKEYPHQLSGGMRQRVMIAMALSCQPSLLIADEPTTALDVTVQAQILDLMRELQNNFGMAVLYITHDLGVIAEIAHDVAVMYLGRIVEKGSVLRIFKHPLHPYTRRLLKSIPVMGKKAQGTLDAIKGNVPIPLGMPPQCGFYSRCEEAIQGKCDRYIPALKEIEAGHWARCFLHSDDEEQENDK